MFEAIISGLSGMVVVMTIILFRRLEQKLLKRKKRQETYSERLSELTESLTKASTEVDEILSEVAVVTQGRQKQMQRLEIEVVTMEQKEQQLKERIERLEKVEPDVARDFAELVKPMQRRSAHRDYILFGAGVIVTTLIAIIIELFTGGPPAP